MRLQTQFSGAFNGKAVILAKLLDTIGIVVGLDPQRLVCKKYARKSVNSSFYRVTTSRYGFFFSVGEISEEVLPYHLLREMGIEF